MTTLKRLEAIADLPVNGGSRSVLQGFGMSSDYFEERLRSEADCDIERQPFYLPDYVQKSTPRMSMQSENFNYTFLSSVDFKQMDFGGNQSVTLQTNPLYVAQNFGCNATDFVGADLKIVLVWYNPDDAVDCDAYTKAINAWRAGASAILIANDATRSRISQGRLRPGGISYSPGLYDFVQVPTFAISYFAAKVITESAQRGLQLYVRASSEINLVPTWNLLCTTKKGDAQNLLVFGAHLDSVPAGPGIDDNGSGAATLLEIAIQFKRLNWDIKNKVQFSFWGAEEPGQFGSRYWVNHSISVNPTTHWNNLRASLNFDTIGSPNGAPMVFDVKIRNSANESFPDSATAGSIAIHDIFASRLESRGIPYINIPFEGGSDYSSFIRAGIPTGGMHSGVDELLTVEQAKTWGKLANADMDPCYHMACDRVSNIGVDLLATTSDAAAYTIAKLASQHDLVKFLNSAGKSDLEHN